MAKRKFRRIVLKLSGERISSEQGFWINPELLKNLQKKLLL